jgi:hypothetical protein
MSRRAALRGLGASVALPLLEAMLPGARGGGAPAPPRPPRRLLYVYIPNGVHLPHWTPGAEGAGFDLPPILEPLGPFREDVLVLSGLTLDPARAHGDGPGDHPRAMTAFLTGRHPHKTPGADLRAGVSADQVIAQKVGGATRFRSLELGCDGTRPAGTCEGNYSCVYQSTISWASETTPLGKETVPRLVFDRLFGDAAGAGGSDAALARRRLLRESILDSVAEDARTLQAQLGGPDGRKLEEYLTGLLEVERRMQNSAPVADVVGGKVKRPGAAPAEFGEHVRLLIDLLALAFQSDMTRVATLVFGNDQSNRTYPAVGVAEAHHEVSHHGKNPEKQAKVAKINRYHVQQLAYLLGRLKEIKEGGGTLLDSCMVVYGSGISDGDAHNHEDLPILVAGRGGGTLRPGRHVRCPKETPLMNLHLALMGRMGVDLPSFGDSTGRLSGLDG